ncbi:MAG: hypothetical protein Q9164_004916 [Protoblastenia rupestris]
MQLMEALFGSKSLITILLISFTLLWKLIASLRYRNAVRRHGCCSVARYPHKDPFLGYDLYRLIERSRQRNDAVPTLQWLFNTYGNGKTFQALTWGVPTVYSADPRIIRAVLKEGFHNFGSLDWATEFLFGESAESLLPQARINVAQFSAAVERSLKGVTRRVMLSPVLSLLPKDQVWHGAFTKVNQLFEHYVDLALANREIHSVDSQESSSDRPKSEPFVLLQELVKESQDREYLCDQLVSIFLPAFQAFPIGLADVLFQVARVPRVWAKLRAEALDLGDIQLTFEVLKSIPYLQCVIKESLRLLAPLDRIVRLCMRNCVLPHGGGVSGEDPIFVQRGTLIDLRNNILHRDTKYWGADANEFRPERWLDPNLQPRWEYLPFGGGMRNCPAHQMTITQFAYIITRLVREFETLENRDQVLEFVEEYTFSKRSQNGVKVALLRAKT